MLEPPLRPPAVYTSRKLRSDTVGIWGLSLWTLCPSASQIINTCINIYINNKYRHKTYAEVHKNSDGSKHVPGSYCDCLPSFSFLSFMVVAVAFIILLT